MTDLRSFLIYFEQWCRRHRRSPRYVTREVLNNSRWFFSMQRAADKQEREIKAIREWMADYDIEQEKLGAERRFRKRLVSR